MAGLLDGIKVVEMGHIVAMPAAAAMLGDWGAEVIKVEPLTGDLYRGMKKVLGLDRFTVYERGEVHWTFEAFNRNKRGLALNLRDEAARDVLYRLIRKSDVFISNYELDSVRKLKVDYATLSQVNPRLVYGVLTGFGSVGPDRNERGFDYSAGWARCGAQYLMAQAGGPPPQQRPGMIDMVAASHVVAAVLAALLGRARTGRGQELEFSLYHSASWTTCIDVQTAIMGATPMGEDRTRAANPLFNPYRTGDNRWFQLAMAQSDLQWPSFCRALGRPDLEKDPRFVNMDQREKNCEVLVRTIDEVMAGGTMEEWKKRFKENNCIFGLVQTPNEVVADPQAHANDFFAEIEHPVAGRYTYLNSPVKFRQDPAVVRSPAPQIGQHTEEILLDLGYSWDEIVRLKEKGAIP